MGINIERASPVETRKSLDMCEAMVRAGVMFVPVPVFDQSELNDLMVKTLKRLEDMAQAAEAPSAAKLAMKLVDRSEPRKAFHEWFEGSLELNLITDQRDPEGHPYYMERPTREAWGAWRTAWITAIDTVAK